MFTSFLAYKLNEQGNHLSLSERVYPCICGVNLDRDYNAAINIKK
ncbi:TPA: transposase [Bacillus thuringiensis]|nr:transposase [Bacillus thuringiensis]